MSLATIFEIKKHSVVKGKYPDDTILRIKDTVEYEFFDHYLGSDFYDLLVADAKNWETIPEWRVGSTYALGDRVFWKEEVRQSKENANSTEPLLTSNKWKEADRFITAEYDTLWKKHLRQIIANKCILESLAFDTFTIGANGVMIKLEDDHSNMGGADHKTVDFIERKLQSIIDTQINQMVSYIKKRHEDDLFDYSAVSFIEGDSVPLENKSNRRFMFLKVTR